MDKKEIITAQVPSYLADKLNRYTKENDMSKSQVIRAALRDYLEAKNF